MKPRYPIQQDIAQIVGLVKRYFQDKLNKEPISSLSLVVHDLRIVIQRVITDYYLQLSLEEEKRFRGALADQLMSAVGEVYAGNDSKDREHRQYCVKEILACFEWAEQIKEEIPDDPVTQKILAIDIPILRPFDYGYDGLTKLNHSHQKN